MTNKKNIILILSDQQRYDTVSAYGLNDICKTPHIDAPVSYTHLDVYKRQVDERHNLLRVIFSLNLASI